MPRKMPRGPEKDETFPPSLLPLPASPSRGRRSLMFWPRHIYTIIRDFFLLLPVRLYSYLFIYLIFLGEQQSEVPAHTGHLKDKSSKLGDQRRSGVQPAR